MIATSKAGKLVALVCACAAHAAIALALFDEEPILIEGGGAVQEARLGASFADMASGTLSPAEAEAPVEPVPPEPASDEAAEPVERTEPVQAPVPEPEATARAETAAARPEGSERLEAIPEQAETGAVAETETAPPEQELAALTPDLPQAVLRATPAPSVAPRPAEPAAAAAAEPPPVEAAEPAEPAEIIADTDRGSGAVAESPRPPRREMAERREPQRQPPPSPRGNADQDATAGAATGRQQADAVRQGAQARAAAEAGNAAASNYPGLVSRHLARVRKPSLNSRGAAQVMFTVSGSGELAGLSVARSSGAQRIDQAALDLVRRAAPFPAPPAGARREFAVVIEFR